MAVLEENYGLKPLTSDLDSRDRFGVRVPLEPTTIRIPAEVGTNSTQLQQVLGHMHELVDPSSGRGPVIRGTDIEVSRIEETWERGVPVSLIPDAIDAELSAEQVWAGILFDTWVRIDQQWLSTPAWFAEESQADEEIACGEGERFATGDDFLSSLG